VSAGRGVAAAIYRPFAKPPSETLVVFLTPSRLAAQRLVKTIEANQRETREAGSALALAAGTGASACFLFRLLQTHRDGNLVALLFQVVLLLLIIRLAVWFHGSVPLPAGIHNSRIPGA
jgi:hypothetical protein